MARIIIDSGCDLPDFLIKHYAITVLPLTLTIEGKDYRDGVDIKSDKVYAAMRRGVTPKTSQVCAESMRRVFTDFLERGEGFVYITFSSALSGTYNTARMTLKELRERYPGAEAEVADSKGGSLAAGLIAVQAAELLRRNASIATVVKRVVEMTRVIEHVFTIADLKWLVRGGRIDPLKGTIGALLGIRPVIDVKEGAMVIIKKARGGAAALSYVVQQVLERTREFPDQLFGIAHSDDASGAEQLRLALSKALGVTNFLVCQIGGVLGSHLGIGGMGVFFFNKKLDFMTEIPTA